METNNRTTIKKLIKVIQQLHATPEWPVIQPQTLIDLGLPEKTASSVAHYFNIDKHPDKFQPAASTDSFVAQSLAYAADKPSNAKETLNLGYATDCRVDIETIPLQDRYAHWRDIAAILILTINPFKQMQHMSNEQVYNTCMKLCQN